MAETIWMSGLFKDHSLHRGVLDRKPGEEEVRTLAVANNPRLALHHRVKGGETFLPEELPCKFYKQVREDQYPGNPQFHSLPPAFSNQFAFVDEDIARILQDFDLADHAVLPIEMYLYDCETRVKKQYYLLNFGVRKRTVDRDKFIKGPGSNGIREAQAVNPLYRLPSTLNSKGNQYFYYPEALGGKDLWVDPELEYVFFFSDRLGEALKKAKFARALRLTPVKGP